MKLYEIRKEAREGLNGKWGKGVGICLAYFAVIFIFAFIAGFFGEDSVIASLFDIIEGIFAVPLRFGIVISFLKLKRGEDISCFDFFTICIDNFARAWKIAGRMILKLIIPAILVIVGFFVFLGGTIYSNALIRLGNTGNTEFSIIVGLIIYIAMIFYFVCRTLLYSLTSYIAYDNKDMTALEVVNESARLMKGNRGKYVLLLLSFIGWEILSIFTFGIGYLWLMPYIQVAEICFYERLAHSKVISNDTKTEDNPIQEM